MRRDPGAAGVSETVGDLVREAARKHADKTFLLFAGDSFTYTDLDRLSDRAAAALAGMGIGRGDRVGLAAANSPEFLFVWFGLAKLGAVLVPVHHALTPTEVGGLLHKALPAAVVTDLVGGAQVAQALELLEESVPVARCEDVLSEEGDPPRVDVSPDDVVVLLPTSGTTGVPKLVMQTHRAYVLTAEAFPWWVGIDETDRLLTALPLAHLNAQAYSTLGALAAGASLALLPRFSARRFWDGTRRYGATAFNTVGAILEILMRQPERGDDADNPVRLCYAAPAPPTKERHLAVERRFGMEITAGYGLSETPFGTIWPPQRPRRYGSMGVLRQHPTLGRINDGRVLDESGHDVRVGEVGELLLRNPAVMKGYFSDPEETARTLTGGWLHTGDLVRAGRDGFFEFISRKKEVIRRRGENIAPAEVEAVLSEHPGVRECAVVRVPSELGEDEIKAFVVLAGEQGADADGLREWCGERLARFKVPAYFEFLGSLPRTSTGRVAKHLLT
jgi:crotonobetaine/carnitine-CoA ligase